MAVSILDKAIEKEATRKTYRDTYNKQPVVKARRTLYNKKRNGEMGVASRFTKKQITREQAEGELALLSEEYLKGVAKLENKVHIPARSAKHTDNS